MIFFIDGYLALASWPPSTMNIFAAIFRVITDFFIQPIFIGLILNILYSIFKELIALKEPKLKLFNLVFFMLLIYKYEWKIPTFAN